MHTNETMIIPAHHQLHLPIRSFLVANYPLREGFREERGRISVLGKRGPGTLSPVVSRQHHLEALLEEPARRESPGQEEEARLEIRADKGGGKRDSGR